MMLTFHLLSKKSLIYLFQNFLFIVGSKEASQTNKFLTEVPTVALPAWHHISVWLLRKSSSKPAISTKWFQNSEIYKVLIVIFENSKKVKRHIPLSPKKYLFSYSHRITKARFHAFWHVKWKEKEDFGSSLMAWIFSFNSFLSSPFTNKCSVHCCCEIYTQKVLILLTLFSCLLQKRIKCLMQNWMC